jgi:hypothetical protein
MKKVQCCMICSWEQFRVPSLVQFSMLFYVSPDFDLDFLLAFFDDTYTPRFNRSIEALSVDVFKYLESITKWLRDSGLAVKNVNTELCVFHKQFIRPISIRFEKTTIIAKTYMNLLGVQFD